MSRGDNRREGNLSGDGWLPRRREVSGEIGRGLSGDARREGLVGT